MLELAFEFPVPAYVSRVVSHGRVQDGNVAFRRGVPYLPQRPSVGVDRLTAVFAKERGRIVVEVGVLAGLPAIAEQLKRRVVAPAGLHALGAKRVEALVLLAALVDPIVLRVRADLLPIGDAGD